MAFPPQDLKVKVPGVDGQAEPVVEAAVGAVGTARGLRPRLARHPTKLRRNMFANPGCTRVQARVLGLIADSLTFARAVKRTIRQQNANRGTRVWLHN